MYCIENFKMGSSKKVESNFKEKPYLHDRQTGLLRNIFGYRYKLETLILLSSVCKVVKVLKWEVRSRVYNFLTINWNRRTCLLYLVDMASLYNVLRINLLFKFLTRLILVNHQLKIFWAILPAWRAYCLSYILLVWRNSYFLNQKMSSEKWHDYFTSDK